MRAWKEDTKGFAVAESGLGEEAVVVGVYKLHSYGLLIIQHGLSYENEL